ncbi:DUF3034 family protein [Undibacterium jejuense]|uniref:DUF3034 family protein n=1 Tax=Undibacterium jejuense TaxID=1344949 RepID=A0A923HHT4_9BURK|nr:DUF3034 family protein [Undibacterium jejuense]MBC3862400.1 DUF3034 family protein [Undibacterium jejuense]
MRLRHLPFCFAIWLIGFNTEAIRAQSLPVPDQGKLLATAGVIQVEGAAGAGLVPWAVITGYGTEDSYGFNAHVTQLNTQDYQLSTYGVALGICDKLELSLSKQEFSGSLTPLDKLKLSQDVVGVKLKLAGDLIADQDNWRPQIAIGAMYKRDQNVTGLDALGVTQVTQLGAKSNQGTDYYLSATKLFLAQSLLLNGTLRMTKANQMGLLGFSGDLHNRYQVMPEVSAAYLLNRKLALGAEYRQKPNNLSIDHEKAYYDGFLAWFPNKNVSVTLAYVDIGDITAFNTKDQHGWYLSVQIGH